MAIIKGDVTIATEIFVEVFSEIYKGASEQEQRSQLGAGVKTVLEASTKFDYGCINCMHRVAMELLKIDGFSLNAEVIQRTGQHSMSFQTSLALLEETIIHGQDVADHDYEVNSQQKSKRRRQEQGNKGRKGEKSFVFSGVNEGNRRYWFNMINLYEQIANDDALQGIWSYLADEEGVLFKR